MAKAESLRRGKPETRSNFNRAKDDFDNARGLIKVSESLVPCPSCKAPNMNMTKRTSTREPQQVQYELICKKVKSHGEVRYGYYSNEGTD